MPSTQDAQHPPAGDHGAGDFAEGPAWQEVAEGWRPLFGGFKEWGFSFEWHDFQTAEDFDWARTFHPGAIELCLNLAGRATFRDPRNTTAFGPQSVAFYFPGQPGLGATRTAGDRHQFITIEYAPEFLRLQLAAQADALHPLIRAVLVGEPAAACVVPVPHLGLEMTHLVESLRHPPVFQPAQRIWFVSKATELAARFFFQPAGGEFFCTRAKRAGQERVEKAQAILRSRLENPPSLEELARQVGCSHYHLSRVFSQQVGQTIQQYVRRIRLERAAELLRTGRCNVTEAAFAVGYNSLSHFSTAFHEMYGCCPGLFALRGRNPV